MNLNTNVNLNALRAAGGFFLFGTSFPVVSVGFLQFLQRHAEPMEEVNA